MVSPGVLLRHRDFLLLWAAQTTSMFGSFVGGTAVQFTAVLVLKASPAEMALLALAQVVPGFLAGLLAGVVVDRLPRRRLMMAADAGRALLLLSIPLATALGGLSLAWLAAVAFLTGVLTVFFDVAYESFLPGLVGRAAVLEGNSKLAASAATSEVLGFGAAGWLVQWLTAPFAVLVDAFSFLASALFLGRIRTVEPRRERDVDPVGLRAEFLEGLGVIWRQPALRVLAVIHVLRSLFGQLFGTLYLLFVTRDLGLQPGVLGLIFAVGGVTSLFGAGLAAPLANRFGVPGAIGVSLLLAGVGTIFIPLAGGGAGLVIALLVANQVVTDPFETAFSVNELSLRQSVAEDRVLGRVSGSVRFLSFASMLLGTGLAAVLGERAGLRNALFVGAGGQVLAALVWILAAARARKSPSVGLYGLTS
jgi:MFS family permease